MLPSHLEKFSVPVPVLDKGFVRLVGVFGDDGDIVEAARVSTGKGRHTHKVGKVFPDVPINMFGEEIQAFLGTCTVCGTSVACDEAGRSDETCDEGNRRFLRYMVRQGHTSPFEMCEIKLHVKLPIFVARQWIRHRTMCLAGDVPLQFDLPGGIERRGSQLYTLTVEEVFNRFQPSINQRSDRQGYAYHKRDRVQGMSLRSLDEAKMDVIHTRIVDVWESGVKRVYRVELETGEVATMSADHRCFTNQGWLRLRDIAELPSDTNGWTWSADPIWLITVGPGRDTGVPRERNPVDEEVEEWRPVVGWEDYYAVSNQGRVRRVVGGCGSRSFGRCKALTPANNGYLVVSLNRPGKQDTRPVHTLVLDAFVGPRPDGLEGCHNDGNGWNNHVENLRWDTPASNAADRVRDGATAALAPRRSAIKSITYAGEQMTYDLEVEGPWHGFSANGMIVHNSINEWSGRYSEMPDETFGVAPTGWRGQDTKNKQGSAGTIENYPGMDSPWVKNGGMESRWGIAVPGRKGGFQGPDHVNTAGEYLSYREWEVQDHAREVYEERLAFGVSKELARIDLPLTQYTQWYCKVDLHNLAHFLRLRLDSHAQPEIQAYARVIRDIVAAWVPLAWDALRDWRIESATVSRQQLQALRLIARGHPAEATVREALMGLPESEIKDFLALLGVE